MTKSIQRFVLVNFPSLATFSGPGANLLLQLLAMRISYKARMTYTLGRFLESILARYVAYVQAGGNIV
jgi:hypothetical protein